MHEAMHAHGGGAPGLVALAAMWSAMMVAMMVPVELPALAGRLRAAPGRGSFAAAASFVAGLLAAWGLFAALAALVQWELHRRLLVDARGVLASPATSAALLVAIGLFQLTPLKRRCLASCRGAAAAAAAPGRAGDALATGLRHGLASLGSCALLMLLPLAAGGMALAPMAALTALLVVEKLGPRGLLVGRAAGAALVVWGGVLALRG